MVDRCKVIVVGGGPAGLLTAANIRGSDVVVIEASTRPGWPPHCTGLVSPDTARRFGVTDAITEVYREAVFLDDEFREICRIDGSPLAVRLSRPILEEALAERVMSLGHRILYGVRVAEASPSGCVSILGRGTICGERIVLAVGASPRFMRVFRAARCRVIPGFEVRVRLNARVNEDRFYTIHGWRVAPQFFAWLVPLWNGREALIGIGGSHPAERLEELIQRIHRIGVEVSSIESHRGGRIVLGPPAPSLLKGRLVGIGDVLCASKPFTGGGLYAISILAEPLAKLIEHGDDQLLLETWNWLRSELKAQYILTRAVRVFQPLWKLALRVVCSAAARGECRIDYDRHSSLVSCLTPRRGALGVGQEEAAERDSSRGLWFRAS